MKTRYTLLFIVGLFLFSSCEKYDEEILPVVGTYDASIVGLTGAFNMVVSVDYGDRVLIDAPFDGYDWFVVEAKIRDKEAYRKRIEIRDQIIDPGIYIYGEGVYFEGSIQLDYSIDFEGIEYNYTLVGSKY
jgi:hypothetical protein